MTGARTELHRNDIEIGFVTHVGMVRTENQDSYGFFEPESDEELRGKGRLVVVCDGMGGHNGGTIASHTAVDALLEAAAASTSTRPREMLRVSIEKANEAVRAKGRLDPELRNMGTTCVAFVARGSRLEVAHVGDSRAYCFRSDGYEQITRDHTYLNDLIDIGLLTPEMAKNHPERNIITRCVGMSDELEIEFNSRKVLPGDSFLLCSDGLYNHVEDEEMHQMVTTMEPQVACQALVDLANKRGGEDNITVAVLKVKEIPSIFDDIPDEDSQDATTGAHDGAVADAGTARDEETETPGSPASTPVVPMERIVAQTKPSEPTKFGRRLRGLTVLTLVELAVLIALQALISRY